MKTSIFHIKNRFWLWTSLFLICFSTIVAIPVVKNIKISPDAMLYSIMSQEILSGNGLKVPVIKLNDNYMLKNGKIPYPEEAPLFPILLAILGGVTPQNYLPAQIINIISLAAISLLTFLIMIRIFKGYAMALLTGILVVTSIPVLRIIHRICTEAPFIAFALAALYFLISSRHNEVLFKKNIIIAGIFASLAYLTRFPGIAIVPVFFWEILILIKNRSARTKYITIFIAVLLPLITSVIIFTRNYIIAGNIYGWNPPPFERSYLDAFRGSINLILQQFPIGKKSLIIIASFLIVFIIYIMVNHRGQKEFIKYFHSGLDLIMVFILSYTVLISIALAKTQEVFEIRFMTPLVPFLFILGIFVIGYLWERVRLAGFYRMSQIGIILSLSIITIGNSYKTYLRSGEFFYKQETHYSILKSCTYNWIRENYGKNIIITTNKPYPLSFFGGYSTIRLPNRRFLKHDRIPDDMELILPDRMFKFGSRILALFDGVDERYDGRYIAKLFDNRKSDENFNLIHECSKGVVYELKTKER